MDRTYETDLHAWALDQADALRRRSANELDWDRLAEELDALGRKEARELYNRYVILLTHLLKWLHQSEKRSQSWRATILEQRKALVRLLEESPSLKPRQELEFADAYELARERAAAETGLPVETFPAHPGFDATQALDRAWLPGDP